MPNTGPVPTGLLPPRALSAERPILRLLAKHGRDGTGSWPPSPDPARMSTALFVVLGSRPFTNTALLDELLARGGRPAYGREVAAAIAHRLRLPASEFAVGRNYMERVRPSLQALLELGILERTPSAVRGRGRPQPFRLREDRINLVRSVLEAFRSGAGLPWLRGTHLARAEMHLQRARRQSWERVFASARVDLARAARQLGLAEARAPERRVGLIRGEWLRESADVLRSQGSYRAAQRVLRSAAARFRTMAADPEIAAAVLEGRARTLTLLGELELRDGAVRRGTSDLEAGLAAYRSRAELAPVDWTMHRNIRLAELMLGEAALLAGDIARAISLSQSVRTGLSRLEEEPGGALTHSDRANLGMNRSRARILEGIAGTAEGHGGDLPIVRAGTEAARAVRLTAGGNGVIWRRLGIALRVRSAVLFLDSRDPRPLSRLLTRAAAAFERSIALHPGEPDTLYEYARLQALVRAARLPGVRDAGLPGGSRIYRQARRTSPDHPANRLDPTLALRSPRPWIARASRAQIIRWLLPSA